MKIYLELKGHYPDAPMEHFWSYADDSVKIKDGMIYFSHNGVEYDLPVDQIDGIKIKVERGTK